MNPFLRELLALLVIGVFLVLALAMLWGFILGWEHLVEQVIS